MSERQHRILEMRHLTSTCFVMKTERKNVPFQAGQCFNVGMGEGVNREYSSYGGEKDDYLEFLIKVVDDGALSPRLQKLKVGDTVEIEGGYGLFTLNSPDNKKYLFIGTGTGIAPFRSFSRSYPQLNYRILHGVRASEDQYERSQYKNYASCVSRGGGGDFQGRVSDYLRKNPASPTETIYLCGNRNMISEVYDILYSQGIPSNQIFTEVFF